MMFTIEYDYVSDHVPYDLLKEEIKIRLNKCLGEHHFLSISHALIFTLESYSCPTIYSQYKHVIFVE
ncbi:hypothetical protein SPFL3102_03871 [Sporomusaceae bacterium FL31]|nr:hypothetical protein SPFL3101_00761 [Sporomusaceae bacterium FL31]GCE36006.1 hypothetical protein SPFL3102_03871 [Sporomusaceae bacterium]